MTKKYIKMLLLCSIIGSQSITSYAEKSPPDTKKETNPKKIPPLPTHAFFPELSYARAPDDTGEYTVEFSKHKFWIVVFIATWNSRSIEIEKIFNLKKKEFDHRSIGVLALFSQNTEHDVEDWRLKTKPLFDNYFASRNLIDALRNPKIPSIWLLGNQGEILIKQELPTIQQIDSIVEKAYLLTGF